MENSHIAIPEGKPKIQVENLSLYYGPKLVLNKISLIIPEKKSHGHNWPFRLRQVDFCSCLEPDE